MRDTAELRDELGGTTFGCIGHRDELQLIRRGDRACIGDRDVPGTDDPDPHASHPSSCSRIERISSLGSKVSGSCSTAIVPV